MTSLLRRFLALLLLSILALSTATSVIPMPAAAAQADVVGSADFRNAPLLPPGQFRDRIVTGDTAWYGLVYTNNTPYRFEVSLVDNSASTDGDLTLSASFVAPTLETIGNAGLVVRGNGSEYASGHTNVWFLKVELATTGTAGIQYEILIDVEGVRDAGLEPCRDLPDCTFDGELQAIDEESAVVRTRRDELVSMELTADVEAEISNLQGFYDASEAVRPAATAKLNQVRGRMAELCAPEQRCTTFPDPGSRVSLIGWVIGFGVLGFGIHKAISKLRQDPNQEIATEELRRVPSSMRKTAKK